MNNTYSNKKQQKNPETFVENS